MTNLKTFEVRVERTVRQSATVTLSARNEKAALNAADRMFREGAIPHWGATEPVSSLCEIVSVKEPT